MAIDAATDARISRVEQDAKEARKMAAEAKSLIDGHEKLCAERFGRIDRTLGRVLGWAVAGAGTTIGMLIAAVATLLWYNITHR